jgi:hypothetical protein
MSEYMLVLLCTRETLAIAQMTMQKCSNYECTNDELGPSNCNEAANFQLFCISLFLFSFLYTTLFLFFNYLIFYFSLTPLSYTTTKKKAQQRYASLL